ncbi:MAG: bifunctional serine/threonine-protein kinase/formylglycine-generating enzyme family protein [Syntrophobacteraceae bacterium]
MSAVLKNALQIGEVLDDKWVVLELLGRGGMGEVYRVHQLKLKRDEAFKVISPGFVMEISENEYEAEGCEERFHREVQVMAEVRHPNVLQIFDCGTILLRRGEENRPVEYIAMEYVPGGTLRSTMSAEGFYPDESRMREWLSTYFLPLLDGVAALHEQGIVHRDLKPENVLLDGMAPKIADFGLARSCRSKPFTQSMDLRGTPPYMSPEHFLDLKRTDRRTDVYALGKILYEAVSGKISSEEIPFKQAHLKDVEGLFYRRLDAVIQAATAEDKTLRTPSVQSLEQALQETLSLEETVPPPAISVNATSAGNWKKRFRITLLVVFVSVATGLGVMSFYKRGYMSPQAMKMETKDHGGAAVGNPAAVAGSAPERPSLPSVLRAKDRDLMHLIPGGTVTLPASFGPNGGGSFKVSPFYLDETLVTNQQYVHFLNRSLSKVRVNNGEVRGLDGRVWLYLGQVMKGYEPIVFAKGKFRMEDAAHAACPVLRVTGYGAKVYANFYGERLLTDVEWLYVLRKGSIQAKVLHGASTPPAGGRKDHSASPGQGRDAAGALASVASSLHMPLPVILSRPDGFGIRDMNQEVGEWGVRRVEVAPDEKNRQAEYVVMAGNLSKPGGEKEQEVRPSAVERYPWEAFSQVGFRCARSAKIENRQG